jgi:hypothetical protein
MDYSASAHPSYPTSPNGGEETRTNLIINYLPQTLSDKELQSLFMTVGPLKSCKVMKDNRVRLYAALSRRLRSIERKRIARFASYLLPAVPPSFKFMH